MKNTIYFIVIVLCFITSVTGQHNATLDLKDSESLYKVPKEQVVLYTNTSFLFAGEYLYYSFHCLEINSYLPSKISKVGYVTLIDEDKNIVIRQKLRLENGKASGDFFVPATVPSGNYKIIGYTKWMLNWKTFFSNDISIINPYLEDQKAILGGSIQNSKFDSNRVISNNLNDLKLNLTSGAFKKRSKVTFKIENQDKLKGKFSLSVRKLDPINLGESPKKVVFNDTDIVANNKLMYLPEFRGELISGKIIPQSDDIKTLNIKVSLSIPNEEGLVLKLSTTNEEGVFHFNVNEKYIAQGAVIQVVGEKKESYKIKLDQHPSIDFSEIEFKKLIITPAMKKYIVERSVHNQIENGYFGHKPDTVITSPPTFSYDHENMLIYNLDDYTRFKTIKETLVEIIDNVWSQKVNDKNVFQVRTINGYDHSDLSNIKPLVVIDGVLIQDHDLLVNYDARKVKRISVMREKYVLGMDVYEGIIMFQTYNGDYKLPNQEEYIINTELFAPEIAKKYFKQTYSPEKRQATKHVPDFRYQLLWDPHFAIDEHYKTVSFYTSDIEGKFKISLNGFTEEGVSISISETFVVE